MGLGCATKSTHLGDLYSCHLRGTLSVDTAGRPVVKSRPRYVIGRVIAIFSLSKLAFGWGSWYQILRSEVAVWPLEPPASPSFNVKVSLHNIFSEHTDFVQTKVRLVTAIYRFFNLNKHLLKRSCAGRSTLATFPLCMLADRACIHGSKEFNWVAIRSQEDVTKYMIYTVEAQCCFESWFNAAKIRSKRVLVMVSWKGQRHKTVAIFIAVNANILLLPCQFLAKESILVFRTTSLARNKAISISYIISRKRFLHGSKIKK